MSELDELLQGLDRRALDRDQLTRLGALLRRTPAPPAEAVQAIDRMVEALGAHPSNHSLAHGLVGLLGLEPAPEAAPSWWRRRNRVALADIRLFQVADRWCTDRYWEAARSKSR